MKDVLKTGQVLGRSEMKKIMAGSGGLKHIGCNDSNDHQIGSVCCSDWNYMQCCRIHYPSTASVYVGGSC